MSKKETKNDPRMISNSEKLSKREKINEGKKGLSKIDIAIKWVSKYLGPRIHGSDLSRNLYSSIVPSGIPNP